MSPRLSSETPIQFLKGVGERRGDAFKRLGVRTVGDLAWHIPHRYEDASTITPIKDVEPGSDVTVVGRVISKGVIPTRKGLRIFQAVVKDATGMIEASWPGQPFLDRSIQKEDVLLLAGPCRFYHGRQLQPREYVNFGADGDEEDRGRVLAVYPATEGLTVRQIRSIIAQHLDDLIAIALDPLPQELRKAHKLPAIGEALRYVHQPESLEQAYRGRDRLAFDELLLVNLLKRRANVLARTPRQGIAFRPTGALSDPVQSALPFALTGAQKRAIAEITSDMCSELRMHRLLQGDVGSGKTIVALLAALLAMESGHQAALMAPTELLAEQHAGTLRRFLAPLGIEPILVVGSLGSTARKAAAARLTGDEPLLAVGTHALIQEGRVFGRLGLAIVDEQHRFGVEQREALGAKGEAPDVLLMSATPIPRSLALTVYGDLDVSTLDERPPGRLPVTTALRPESGRQRVLDFVASQVAQGRQAYVVYPVIEESEKIDLKAATTMHAELSEGPFSDRKVGLLHGRIPAEERDSIMREFRDGRIDVLVATTVIEVGIDVPNATIMVIEHPERFGLSQLHQLRGRVGRGAEQSFCILLGNVGEDAYRRLQIFVSTEDGFEIARADMRIRGMGDLFGARQSGDPSFRIADPIRDEHLNVIARQAAGAILVNDPTLESKKYTALRRVMTGRYSRALELFRVG